MTRRHAAMAAAVLSLIVRVSASAIERQGARPNQTATVPARGALSGIVTDDRGAPVDNALVGVITDDGSFQRTVVTDADGRFHIGGLPIVPFHVMGSAPGHITAPLGARSIDAPDALVTPAESGPSIALRLDREVIMSGVVRGQDGAPLEGVVVRAWHRFQTAIRAHADDAGAVFSDRRGIFRFVGLPPGRYVVSAAPGVDTPADLREQADGLNRRVEYVPVYFGQTSDAAAADVLTLAAGDERDDVNIVLSPVELIDVDGSVEAPDGRWRFGVFVLDEAGVQMSVGATVSTDLRFTFGVPPGRYTIAVQGTQFVMPADGPQIPRAVSVYGASALTASAGAPASVSIVARAPIPATGHVVVAPSVGSIAASPPNWFRVWVQASPLNLPASFQASARPDHDGAFSMSIPAGRVVIGLGPATATAAPWTVASVTIGGAEVTDLPVDVDGPLAPIAITLTTSVATLEGTLTGADGSSASGQAIVAFADDRRYWYKNSRRLCVIETDANGHFAVVGLPPGSYRLAAADTVIEDLTPAFLDELRRSSIPFTLADGEHKIQNVRVRSGG